MLSRDDYHEESVFLPENLLREARRQNHIPDGNIPPICLLDPDGDIVRYVNEHELSTKSAEWACYHSTMHVVTLPSGPVGIVGCAVGAPYAVLVAEQMRVSGCEFLISITSAGRVSQNITTSTLVVIERALRGEGTSYAYLPGCRPSLANRQLVNMACDALRMSKLPVVTGTSWTTDAPYRETRTALAQAEQEGAIAVEMEAAALYAFAEANEAAVLCLAHVTNDMAINHGDFEKGDGNGAAESLIWVDALASAWKRSERRSNA